MRKSIFILSMISLVILRLGAQDETPKAKRIYYPSLKVVQLDSDPIVINIDGTMYNKPSQSIQIDKITSGRHLLTIYEVKYRSNGKMKYKEIFNGYVNIKPERLNIAIPRKRGMLVMKYNNLPRGTAYVDRENRKSPQELRPVEIKPKYNENFADGSVSFIDFQRQLDETSFESEKVNKLKNYLKQANGISVEQLKELCMSTQFESTRIEFIEAARPYILDKENISTLEQLFEIEDYKNKVKGD